MILADPLCRACQKTAYPTERLSSQIGENKDVYHKSCFKCKTCAVKLSLAKYNMWENLPYCDNCFVQISSQNKAVRRKNTLERKPLLSTDSLPISLLI